MKLGLGTVQFGLDYGISNPDGKTGEGEAARILSFARQKGIQVIDTAAGYGDSEAVLGRTLPEGHDFRLVTKTPGFSPHGITPADALALEETFRRSLRNLRLPFAYGLLVHRADDLLAENGHLLMERMRQLKEEGLVSKVGASVYTADQIDRILDRFTIDLIQLPINVLDQRLLANGHLAMLKGAGVEIHSRSAFLQGVLLMEPDCLPSHFDSVKPSLRRYHDHLRRRGITAVEGALGFVMGIPELDAVICGVNSQAQLAELCIASPLETTEFRCFACDDEVLIDPSRWRFSD